VKPVPKPLRQDRKRVKAKAKKRRIAIADPDYWFSLCVRERANWTCESCGKHYEPWISAKGDPANPGLHCSHYIGRANYATRFEPMNANAHCYGCHSKFEQNPHVFQEWKKMIIGNTSYEILIEKSTNIMLGKQARQEKAQIAEHFKEQFQRMRQSKEFTGYKGQLGFTGYL